MSKKMDNIITSIYITKTQQAELDKLAVKLGVTRTELIRNYITKGMAVDGYSQDIDVITTIIRQEINAVYRPEEINAMMEKQADRIAKLVMKLGKMVAGTFFLLVKMLLKSSKDPELTDCLEMIRDTQELGIGYMQIKDGDINRFLQDPANLILISQGVTDLDDE